MGERRLEDGGGGWHAYSNSFVACRNHGSSARTRRVNLPRGRKLKFLYVLALFQLVAGPLVLWQVTVFTKLAAREAPSSGVAAAFMKAWHSDEFQAALQDTQPPGKKDAKSPLPTSDPKGKLLKGDLHAALWKSTRLPRISADGLVLRSDWSRRWTPVWPQAPPGPPPRMEQA